MEDVDEYGGYIATTREGKCRLRRGIKRIGVMGRG